MVPPGRLESRRVSRRRPAGDILAGAGGVIWCTLQWASHNFGPLHYWDLLNVLIPSLTALVAAIQFLIAATPS